MLDKSLLSPGMYVYSQAKQSAKLLNSMHISSFCSSLLSPGMSPAESPICSPLKLIKEFSSKLP
jgi:hypothetical protein